MSGQSRILFLDVFRFLLVSFALISHIILAFGIEDLLGERVALLTKSLTRTATPALLLLFGIMVELVYRRRFAQSRSRTATAIMARSLTCYICFVFLGTLALLTGRVSLMSYAGSLILIQDIPLANIFSIYAFMLPLSLVLLQLDRMAGLWPIALLALGLVALDILFLSGRQPLPYPLGHFGGFLLGIGENWGPSILHGLLLVMAGMVICRAMFVPDPAPSDRYLCAFLVAGSIAFLTITAVAHPGDPVHVLRAVADYGQWRGHNQFGYFAFGICTTVALLGLSRLACRTIPAIGVTQAIGRRTLTYFLLGNALLLLRPPFRPESPHGALLIICAFLGLSIALTLVWARGPEQSRTIARLNMFLDAVAGRMTATLAIPGRSA